LEHFFHGKKKSRLSIYSIGILKYFNELVG